MTATKPTTRREFLEITVATLGPVLLGLGCGEGSGVSGQTANPFAEMKFPATEVPLSEMLKAYFQGASGEHVRAIGQAYLAPSVDAEAKRSLSEALAATVQMISKETSLDAASARMDQRIIEDFETGRVQSLAGWQLSLTELHLCALSHILHF